MTLEWNISKFDGRYSVVHSHSYELVIRVILWHTFWNYYSRYVLKTGTGLSFHFKYKHFIHISTFLTKDLKCIIRKATLWAWFEARWCQQVLIEAKYSLYFFSWACCNFWSFLIRPLLSSLPLWSWVGRPYNN